VLSVCNKKIPETGWFINKKHLFLIVLEAGDSGMTTLTDLMSDERPFLGTDCRFLAVSSRGGKDSLWSLFYKASILLMTQPS